MRIPLSTYRIQFNPEFTFADAGSIVPYLSRLGISHLYASPVFKSKTQSPHGYDIVDPNTINPELGGEDGLLRLWENLLEEKMGWLQDIVPNHMCYDQANGMLMDVLEKKEKSPYYEVFDINWHHPSESYGGQVLAPFLGRFYSECLEDGEIQIAYDAQGLCVRYYDLRFPLKLDTYEAVFSHRIHLLEEALADDQVLLMKYIGSIGLLQSVDRAGSAAFEQCLHGKAMLRECYDQYPPIKLFVDENIKEINGVPGDPDSFTLLDQILSRQSYRLSYWKVAAEELNYRRFFTINDLISINVNRPEVFQITHGLIGRMMHMGIWDALRVDHIDGLADPNMYLRQLRKVAGEAYIVAEKILDMEENLPLQWPIQGTTGYDFLNYVGGLFCEYRNKSRFTQTYCRFTGMTSNYRQVVSAKKRLIIGKHMAGDIDNLAYQMKQIAGRQRYGRDITLYGLKRALVEVATWFPVYRTYISAEHYTESDRRYVKEAIDAALRSAPGLHYEMKFIEGFFGLEYLPQFDTDQLRRRDFWHLIQRFQQTTAPIMAKGFEDTLFYVYNRLISLNEVGGDPDRFGIQETAFHDFNAKRQERFPSSMNATATHDTKRGEDARMRIHVLSEIPSEWQAKLKSWNKMNQPKKTRINGEWCPTRNDEYLIYQSLIGAYPLEEATPDLLSRVQGYLIKAVREAKEHTAWIKPDEEYESAAVKFLEKLIGPKADKRFLDDFLEFHKKITVCGAVNSLSQILLKIMCPGIPDFYQGTELWDFSLVDPDNRRPVDYSRRWRYLQEIESAVLGDRENYLKEVLSHYADGRVKMFLIHQALHTRNEYPDIFLEGKYLPLTSIGTHKRSVLGFARRKGKESALIVVPRKVISLMQGSPTFTPGLWGDTSVKVPSSLRGMYTNIFTGRTVDMRGDSLDVDSVLTEFPCALLIKQ